jgi:hypothetical protein
MIFCLAIKRELSMKLREWQQAEGAWLTGSNVIRFYDSQLKKIDKRDPPVVLFIRACNVSS